MDFNSPLLLSQISNDQKFCWHLISQTQYIDCFFTMQNFQILEGLIMGNCCFCKIIKSLVKLDPFTVFRILNDLPIDYN